MKSASSFTVIVSFICLALIGLAVIPLLPVKLNPSRTLPGFTVEYNMPGSSSRVVEMEVTSKIESMLARIKGVKKMSSNSNNGSGDVTVELDKHVDIDAARFEASTIIRQIWPQLPDGVSYPIIRMKMPDSDASRPFMTFTLNAPVAPILIQQYAEENIKPKLAQLPGIYKIDLQGATPMEWQLEYDSEQLRQLGVSVTDIIKAIQLHYTKEFMGTHDVDTNNGSRQWIRIVIMPEKQTTEFDASKITVSSTDGKLLKLNELVKVAYTEEKPQRYFRINGLNSIYLSIVAEESANQLQLGNAVAAEMQELIKHLPTGYEVHTSYDATEYIRKELNKIYFRTGLTVLILLVFVWLITHRPKYLFLIFASLTVNIAVAMIFYYLLGLEMQLYSLAGITISLNLIIDSTIVMADHIMHRHNLKAFTSVLAATLTTMGALVIIFFLDEKIRLNLQDFAAVVIINLAVSLMVSLFFVPAMIEKTNMLARPKKKQGRLMRWCHAIGNKLHLPRVRTKRLTVHFTRFYATMIRFLHRWRWATYVILILGFGLPVFLLPEKMNGDGRGAQLYNKVIGNETYKEKVKPIVDKALGGALRLFVQQVYQGSYFTRNEEVVLYANANMPNGSTLDQMNTLIKKMETYLSTFKEIRQFQTSIQNARRASIQIYFTKEAERSGFPYILKANMTSKALQLGGGSWSIYGLQDQGFSNDVRENAGSYRIKMYGYNYDELYSWAERLKEKLMQNRRIKEVLINAEFSWWKDDYQEYFFKLDKEQMAKVDVSATTLFTEVEPIWGRNIDVGTVSTNSGVEKIRLSSRQAQEYDIWAMRYYPLGDNNGKQYKLSEVAAVEKGQMPQKIVKENQQYSLSLQYEYIGSYEMGHKLQKKDLEEFNQLLPMGYTAEAQDGYGWWTRDDNKQYALLLVVIGIIFFITGILFNSFKQPLAIIFVIPISYIGVFLTFYLFQLNFDQGGFASFVLLCGITVNASIYILNEYNNIRRRYPKLSALRAYTKAWNAKIIPIFLTVVSTILGFIPFMVGTDKEAFWFPLAAGTIGGLVLSVIGIFFYLPIFVYKRPKNDKESGS